MRALISVYDKSGLVPFARGLADLGFELVASGGTATALADAGLAITRVEELTGFPRCSAGASRRSTRASMPESSRVAAATTTSLSSRHASRPFDLVCVNLYPFELVADRAGMADDDVIEMIDVGGPSMLRAAAKNFTSVVAVCRPQDYGDVLAELRERKGKVSLETRRRLAGLAFASSAAYESAIARWFQRGDDFPETFVPAFDRVLELAYGENPHQRAALYAERGHRGHVLSRVDQLAGKPLSFNNLNDLSAARLLVRELENPRA